MTQRVRIVQNMTPKKIHGIGQSSNALFKGIAGNQAVIVLSGAELKKKRPEKKA